ncbi:Zn-dependent hydrolase, including glyoxylase [Archaeoglobus sulfaticallidus PM70-1]|uniref:Zn-dependent hydrolase, including glyoxylase n=1 Tax=Archaeoglobus sulfaticallidus PM70-1 TaxID=387631 RepID=N0BKN8_9EURY|nr:MBL fold metallo-hydrolase [Archaeoglobus sulfaticallidus]AGK60775.1 Zn-dependent hydrolase, including glyoxylase [Archaeoglobus sulfaticallidus PM70-1]
MLKIDERTFLLEGKNKGKFPYCNCLLLDSILIDAGLGDVGAVKDRVEVVLLSHTHPDHVLDAWVFNEMGRKVLSPEGFETDIDTLANRLADELAEYWKEFVKGVGLRGFKSEKYEEGLIFENPEIIAYKLPGHTLDMHVFLIDGRIMYGADIDLTRFGPWYGNPESDLEQFRKSIEELRKMDFELYISSHLMKVFSREEFDDRIEEYLRVFDERDRLLLELLEDGKSLEDLVEISPFYRKKPYAKELLDFFERNMIRKHLDYLISRGLVREEDGFYYRN